LVRVRAGWRIGEQIVFTTENTEDTEQGATEQPFFYEINGFKRSNNRLKGCNGSTDGTDRRIDGRNGCVGSTDATDARLLCMKEAPSAVRYPLIR